MKNTFKDFGIIALVALFLMGGVATNNAHALMGLDFADAIDDDVADCPELDEDGNRPTCDDGGTYFVCEPKEEDRTFARTEKTCASCVDHDLDGEYNWFVGPCWVEDDSIGFGGLH
ncbi:MAG: hypothetical protein ACN2B6_02505 [Rickettsiales bacterium]